jgi:hypothetical protein
MSEDYMYMFVLQLAGGITVILGAYFSIVKFLIPLFKKINRWFETWELFLIDWSGEDARPGRDRVPGVMERLNAIDGELKNNGGSSVKDAVDRIEIKVNEVDERLLIGDQKFDEISQKIKNLEDKTK